MSWRRAVAAAAMAAVALAGCGSTPTPAATGTPSAPPHPASETAPPVTNAPTPAPTQPALATSTDMATAAVTVTPTSPAGPVPRQLTSGGCCVQPFWSADGAQVRYIDRPSSGQPSGIWAVPVAGGAPSFVTARLGITSPDERLVAYPEGGQTYIEQVGGKRWVVANAGRAVIFSPDSTRIAWMQATSPVDFDTRSVTIWTAAVDGRGARKEATLVGGGLAGWFPDGQGLLVTDREQDATVVQALSLADGSLTPITRAARLQGLALSPQGGWVAYAVEFSGEAAADGLWVAPANGGAARRLEDFGAFAWRSEGKLLVIPLEVSVPSNRLVEVDAASGARRALTDPALTPFQIAAGNWALSPDGKHLAYTSALDHNIWVLDLGQ